MPFTGHCLCGAVTYVVNVSEPDLVAYCHCDDCQRQSGSTYSSFIIVPKETVIIKGQIQTFTNKGSSGLPVHRQFCVQCGSPLFDEALSAPNELAIKSGSLSVQQKEKLQPTAEFWTANKLPFCGEHLSNAYWHMPE
ncbi:Mss4-like protein [Aspergillus tamarii]|uniref:Mss4-like protein n=1 Tax=Aspergillus tamarii TaxID=41984 RepID=A0A5N6UZR0_ASPTM|nr:Mss4-like protein [Aspergillus tamarii]